MARTSDFNSANVQSLSATNFGLTRDEVWLHLQFTTSDSVPERWLLEVAHASLDRVDLYVAEQDGDYQHQQAGDLLPFTAKALPHRRHLFEQPVQPVPARHLTGQSTGTCSRPCVTMNGSWRAA